MSNVCVVTPFRNSEQHIPRYIEQATSLDYPASKLRWSLVEGDSTDNTLAMLRDWAKRDNRVVFKENRDKIR